MTPAEMDSFADASAAYVHIPFCSAVCPYCDFAVVAGQDDQARRYVGAVKREILRSEPWRDLDAVYFGGGTPSHVAPELLGELLETLAEVHGFSPDVEVSLEANPEDFRVENASQLFSIGFNRVSFGAQSFDSDVLTSLGRRHRPHQILASVKAARHSGFDNVSLDLIYGTPGESDVSWKESLANAIATEPDHISCYALTVERGTPLGRAVRDGAEAPDPDTQADRYEMAGEFLAATGLTGYEVSNWARPGKECRYNLTVWAQGEYLAYGNGAHRFHNGARSRNIRRLDAYIEAVERNGTAVAGSERIAGWDGTTVSWCSTHCSVTRSIGPFSVSTSRRAGHER
jgi:oxygen-independent coproporphyrinogen-3 oxidase